MLKPILITIISLFFLHAAVAQKADTVIYYLKKSGKLVSTKDSADYLLLILPPDTDTDKSLFVAKEFYSNGKIRFIGHSQTKKLTFKNQDVYEPLLEGGYVSFFRNGNKMIVSTYKKGEPVGNEIEYYPNGRLYNIKTHTKNKEVLYNEFRDSTGKVIAENGNGKGIKFSDLKFKNNYIEGEVNNGLEEGEWRGIQNDSVKTTSQYKNGKLLFSKITISGREIYTLVDVIPEFPGGLQALAKFLSDNIKYPTVAREKGIHGRVLVTFIVEPDGTLSNIIRTFKQSPLWNPGSVNGMRVPVAFTVPVAFMLSN